MKAFTQKNTTFCVNFHTWNYPRMKFWKLAKAPCMHMRIQLQSKREIKSNMSNMNVEWQLCFLHETLVSLCLHVFRCFPLFSFEQHEKKKALICWCYCFRPCQPTALVHYSVAFLSIKLNDFRSHKFMANSIKTDTIFFSSIFFCVY